MSKVSAVGAVSPHLDDLALSCADLLAAHPGSSMVTVFAGGPASVDPVTGWEAISGMFEAGADIVGARRAEDSEAATLLGCTPVHLDHWDEQYRHGRYRYRGPTDEELVAAVSADLEDLIGRSGLATWLVPLGISHPDHEITAAACLAVAERHAEIEWLVYEELPYAVYEPGRVEVLTAGLEGQGFGLRPAGDLERSGPGPGKRRVLECYASQVPSLGDGVRDALSRPERVHRLCRLG
jgi:LmbE family N-acetylglucosaminyl deacetylase